MVRVAGAILLGSTLLFVGMLFMACAIYVHNPTSRSYTLTSKMVDWVGTPPLILAGVMGFIGLVFLCAPPPAWWQVFSAKWRSLNQ